jgi:Na+/H+-dicarboxylate symporter
MYSGSYIIKSYLFTICLLCGIILGGVAGVLWGEETAIVKPVGDIFLNLLFVLIVPLVFFSVSSSVCNMKRSGKLGKMMGSILLVFFVMAVIAAVLAYFVTWLYNPLSGISQPEVLTGIPEGAPVGSSFSEMFVRTFTVSDFRLLFSKSNLLPLLVFALLFGWATAFSGEKGELIAQVLDAAANVIFKMIGLIMKAAPVGLGCYFADTAGKLGGQILNGYLHVFILYLILTAIVFFGFHSFYAFLAGGKKGFLAFWKNMPAPSLTAIATSSSAACIPVNIKASERIGIPAGIAETVIPFGTNIHKDGSVMGGVLKIVFLFTLFGNEMAHAPGLFMVVGAAILVGAVMGAIPGGGMTGELLICSVFGFNPQLAGTLMIISTIIDIPATLLNSTGNIAGAMLVARLTNVEKHIVRLHNQRDDKNDN